MIEQKSRIAIPAYRCFKRGGKKEEYSRFPLITVRRRFSHGEAKQKQKNTLPKSKEQFLKANANCYEINFATKRKKCIFNPQPESSTQSV